MCGVGMNVGETEQLVTGSEEADMTADSYIIRKYYFLTHLMVTLTRDVRNDEGISCKIKEGQIVKGRLNSVCVI